MCNGLFWGFSCVMFFVIEMERQEKDQHCSSHYCLHHQIYTIGMQHHTNAKPSSSVWYVAVGCAIATMDIGSFSSAVGWGIDQVETCTDRTPSTHWSWTAVSRLATREYTITCTDDYGDGWSGHVLTILIGDLIVCDSSQQSWKTEYAFATTFGACLWTMDVTCGAEDDATGAITCQSVGEPLPGSLLVTDVWIRLQQTMT